jgi:hypothetical protein
LANISPLAPNGGYHLEKSYIMQLAKLAAIGPIIFYLLDVNGELFFVRGGLGCAHDELRMHIFTVTLMLVLSSFIKSTDSVGKYLKPFA